MLATTRQIAVQPKVESIALAKPGPNCAQRLQRGSKLGAKPRKPELRRLDPGSMMTVAGNLSGSEPRSWRATETLSQNGYGRPGTNQIMGHRCRSTRETEPCTGNDRTKLPHFSALPLRHGLLTNLDTAYGRASSGLDHQGKRQPMAVARKCTGAAAASSPQAGTGTAA